MEAHPALPRQGHEKLHERPCMRHRSASNLQHHLAPLYLFVGDHSWQDIDAIEAYPNGLQRVEEPDLESRLLCAPAGRLPADSKEHKKLVARAIDLKGSLMALATAKLMGLQYKRST